MNKKLLSAALGTLMVLGLTACGGGGEKYSTKILADADHAAYCAMGAGQVGTATAAAEDLKNLAWDYSEAGLMTATSVKGVSEVSTDLADVLATKPLSALYIHKTIRLGANDAGWTTNAIKNGEVVTLNGAYAIKGGSFNYDSEDKVYSVDEWLPNPAHFCETLTPATLYMCPHTETPEVDAAGNDWNANPACISGAGVYAFVVARYSKVVGDSWFGLALVKLAELSEPEAPETYEIDHLSLVGKFKGVDDWDVGHTMTKGEGNTWTITVELDANDEIKVRANDEWKYAWGYSALTDKGTFEESDNIKIAEAGNYLVTITLPGTDLLIEANRTPTVFTAQIVVA